MTDASTALAPGAWKVLIVATLGSVMAQIDATIVNVSLSSLAGDLRTTLGTIQWVTSGYLLALTLILPLNGWLVDRIGARAVYLWCFAAFTVSSALCGLAWSAPSLIGFRVVQGLAGGLLAPMAQMMVARVAGKDMARVAAYVTVPILLAPLLGPVIAGAILQHASWRWLFLVNVPVGAVAISLAALFLPNDRHERRQRDLDLVGLALLSPALVLFLYSADRLTRLSGLALFMLSLGLLAAFLWTAARKGKRALIDLELFHSPLFSLASIVQFLSNGTTFAGQMLIPLYLIDAAGRSPAEMGWLMAPLGLGMICAFPSAGFLAKHLGTRALAAGGALLATVATAAFVFLAAHEFNLVALTVALFLRGAGLGGIGIPAVTTAYSAVARPDLPMATTTLNIIQRLGGPALTTLCATFLGWQLSLAQPAQSGSTAYMWAFALLSALHAATFLVALGFPARAKRTD